MNTTCISCGCSFEPLKVPHPFDEGRFIFTATRCPACVEEYERRQAAALDREIRYRKEAKSRDAWEALAPAGYRATDSQRLQVEHPKVHSVLNRHLTNRGLIL